MISNNPLNANVALTQKPVNGFACGAPKGIMKAGLHKTFWHTASKSIDWFLCEGNIGI